MSISQDNLDALSAVAVLAEEYCSFIESLQNGRPAKLYHTLEALLARLHLAILPVEKEVTHEEHPEFEELDMAHEQLSNIARLVRKTVGAEAAGLMAWHEELLHQDDRDLGYCATRAEMLDDDLADIYSELLYGLALWKIGTADAQAEAAWQWRFGYEAHWGDHLFRAMTTAHEAQCKLHAD